MKIQRWFVLALSGALALIFSAACWNRIDQPPKPVEQDVVQIAPGVAFPLKSGQKATLNTDEVVVSFVSVSEDSRCPSDVACVWEGQVTTALRVIVKGEAMGDFSLTLRGGQPASVEVKGYTLTLSAVDPYPNSKEPIKPVDYEATLTLSQ